MLSIKEQQAAVTKAQLCNITQATRGLTALISLVLPVRREFARIRNVPTLLVVKARSQMKRPFSVRVAKNLSVVTRSINELA